MRVLEVREPFGVDALSLSERPDPVAGPGQVVLRTRALALNYRDVLVVNGRWKPTGPRIPFSDAVGVVVAVGAGVSRVAVGERVAPIFYPRWVDGPVTAEKAGVAPGGRAWDGFGAEYVAVDAEAVVRVPEHLSDEEAATLPTAAVTAWNATMHAAATRPGHAVVVQGTGGVSLFGLQLARLAGAHVVVTSGSPAKLERARALGAGTGIDYRATPDWPAAVREATGGGADLVLDPVGDLDASIAALRPGGTVSFIGFLRDTTAKVDLVELMGKSARIQAIDVGSRVMFEELNAALACGAVRPVVDRVFGFHEAREALAYLATGRHFGKVVLAL